MNPTIQNALEYLRSEEDRLRQISIDRDKAIAEAKDAADATNDEWHAVTEARKALEAYTSDRSGVRF